MTEVTGLSDSIDTAITRANGESHGQARQWMDVITGPVLLCSMDGTLISCNQAFEQLSGSGVAEILGRPLWEIIRAPDDSQTIKSMFECLSGVPSPSEFVALLKPQRAEEVLFEWTLTQIKRDADLEDVVVCVGTTARVQEQESVSDPEVQLQAILDTAVDGIATIDEHGLIEKINPALQTMFGYTKDELVGLNVNQLMPQPYRDEHDSHIEHYVCSGEKRIIGIGREVAGLRKDGSVFPIELVVSEGHFRSGKRFFTGILRDISDRRATEQRARLRLDELAHTSRLLELGEMTSGIAHEVNQPLTAIVSFAQACLRLVHRDKPDLEVISDALTKIVVQGQRAAAVVRHLRALTKRGASQRSIVAIDELAHGALGLIRQELTLAQVTPKVIVLCDKCQVQVDPIQIEQVLINLLRNALEAMSDVAPLDRTLSLSIQEHDSKHLEVIVEDSGGGLSEQLAQRVFETFYSTKSDGMGVGLAICRTIIEAHGGRLWAQAGPMGQFHFVLPRSRAPIGSNRP